MVALKCLFIVSLLVERFHLPFCHIFARTQPVVLLDIVGFLITAMARPQLSHIPTDRFERIFLAYSRRVSVE